MGLTVGFLNQKMGVLRYQQTRAAVCFIGITGMNNRFSARWRVL